MQILNYGKLYSVKNIQILMQHSLAFNPWPPVRLNFGIKISIAGAVHVERTSFDKSVHRYCMEIWVAVQLFLVNSTYFSILKNIKYNTGRKIKENKYFCIYHCTIGPLQILCSYLFIFQLLFLSKKF